MRLKTFTAATIAEAMQQVRDELGPDAAIFATEEGEAGVRVLAALETPEPTPAPPPPRRQSNEWLRDPTPQPPPAANTNPPQPKPAGDAAPATLRETLAYHGVPAPIVARLATGASGASFEAALAARLRETFRFAALGESSDHKPLLLAGPPGVGKTLATAKLAARAVMAGMSVRLITTDDSAGAVDQLTAFARPLKLAVETADGPAGLAAAMARSQPQAAALTLIDTQGITPYDDAELAGLAAQIAASRAEAVLVLGAGGDAQDSGEIAEIFARIGCTHLLVTRLDLARRLGGILTAAAAGLTLTGMGASPIMVHGLQPLTPDALAGLLIAPRLHFDPHLRIDRGRNPASVPSEHTS